jgi:hypothetical protein
MTTETKPAATLLEQAENLSRDLLKGACTGTHKTAEGKRIPCCEAERTRPLTAAEKRQTGGTLRHFGRYDDARMCAGCAGYWHASRAEAFVRDLAQAEKIAAAEAKRVEG